MHAARQQGGSLDSVPGLKLPTLSSSSWGPAGRGILLPAEADGGNCLLCPGTCKLSGFLCSLIRTSFAISGNCPLSVQKLCYQTLGAELAGNLPCLTLPWPAEEPRCLHRLGREDKGLGGVGT